MNSPSDLSRSEQRRLEFQKKIIDAAIELFAENGVNETPVTEIIRRAGIAHKTFFNHFPSKHYLLIEIARQYSTFSDAIFEGEIARDIMPVEKLENSMMSVAHSISSLDGNHLKMFKSILTGSQVAPEEGQVFQQEKLAKNIGIILKEAEYRGQLREGLDIETYVEQVTGLFVAAMMIWSSQAEYPLVDRMKRTVAFIRQSVFQ